MLYQCYYYYGVQLIAQGFLAPKILFTYDWFPFLHPLPAGAMNVILALMTLGTVLVAAGWWMRVGAVLFATGQAYFLLLEKSYWNNHIYLFILVAVLLCFTHADHFVSLRPRKNRVQAVARGEVLLLQAQIVLVYFYGGLTKINPYWLFEQEPVRSLLANLPDTHALAGLIKNPFGVQLLTYGGLLLDLAAPILLWKKSVRNWAIWLFVGFNLVNSRIFNDIGVFPFVMLGTVVLFYDANELWFTRWLPGKMPSTAPAAPPVSLWALRLSAVYFVFQLLFPFRGHLLPNPLDYTTIGNRFSWRMKVDTRLPEEVSFLVINPAAHDTIPVDIRPLINPMQIWALTYDPRSVADMGRYLKKEAAKRGIPHAVVQARIRIRYNGGPSQYFVDPEADLGDASVSPFQRVPWLVPPAR